MHTYCTYIAGDCSTRVPRCLVRCCVARVVPPPTYLSTPLPCPPPCQDSARTATSARNGLLQTGSRCFLTHTWGSTRRLDCCLAWAGLHMLAPRARGGAPHPPVAAQRCLRVWHVPRPPRHGHRAKRTHVPHSRTTPPMRVGRGDWPSQAVDCTAMRALRWCVAQWEGESEGWGLCLLTR